jgi:uncharacterized peroxidase-related enzyme
MSFFPSLPEDTGLKQIQEPYADIWQHWARFSQALMRGPGPLTVAERELVAAYTSGLNRCSYCYHDHMMATAEFGTSPEVFEGLLDDIDGAAVDDKMKPILKFARKLTLEPTELTQGDADAVFAAGWDEAALHFTVAICGRFNLINRLVMGHGVEHSDALTAVWRDDQKLSYAILDEAD